MPRPEVRGDDPLRVRHRPIPGTGWRPGPDDAAEGRALGAFLGALHGLDPGDAVAVGARDADAMARDEAALRDRCATDAVPRLPPHHRPAVLGALMRLVRPGAPSGVPIHGDLRADHVRCRRDAPGAPAGITGVIDWLDAGVADPARDLAWPLHATTDAFAAGFAAAYRADVAPLREPARDWARLAVLRPLLRALDRDAPPADVAAALTRVDRGLAAVERR